MCATRFGPTSVSGSTASALPEADHATRLPWLSVEARNGAKYLAAVTLVELRNDPQWLARAPDVVMHWKQKGECKSQSVTETEVSG